MKGLEPSTFCMASRRSSQLSYIRGFVEYRATPAWRPGRMDALQSAQRGSKRPSGRAVSRLGAAPGSSPRAAPDGQLTGADPPTAGGLPPPDVPGQWCPDVLEPPLEVEPLAPVEPLFDDGL